MPEKEILVVLHGMGIHTADSFKEEVVKGANAALNRYPGYKNRKFEQEVDIHSIGYDHIFEDLRQRMAQQGQGIKDFISQELPQNQWPEFLDDLTDIEAGLGSDKFVYTHVLDVIFYLTMLGERVRTYVNDKLLEIIQANPGRNIHVLAHSLGSAVAHDTLNKLFTVGQSTDTELSIDQHRLQSLWMIANVSDLITSISGLTSPYDSLVKPGDGGCLVKMHNAFHRFDPFTLKPFKRFDPDNSNGWLSPVIYQYRYQRYKTEKVSRLNTHSIEGYLEDPVICHDFLSSFMDFHPDHDSKVEGDSKFKHIQGKAEEIIDFISDIDSVSELKVFLKMIKEFFEFIKMDE